MNELITTAPVLWEEISQTAQFQHKEYDMDMLREIRGKLGLPLSGSMPVLLKKYGIPCEALLNAVLSCMQPFAEMLNDLYAMFQKAGAQQSDHNLQIHFDFNRHKETFATDLDFFRQQTESANRLIVQAVAEIPIHPFDLCRKIAEIWQPDCNGNPRNMYPEGIQKWLQEYETCPKLSWPDYVPEKPSTGYAELDKQIGVLWQILAVSLWTYRNAYKSGNQQNIAEKEDANFWYAETDRWIGAYVKRICDLLIFFKQNPPEQHLAFAAYAAEKIKCIIEKCPMRKVTVEEIHRAVTDILNLPFWKKRYELYSVWVCSQILKALPEKDVRYNVKNHTLSFSFSGSHIATLPSYNPPLELWAEVRTYYASPKGSSRRSHIQPDYTLAIGNAYNADHSVVVVECKQYKKYSRKNFLNAAEDYAGGRPKANVFLVNYGAISSLLEDSADEKYRDRIKFYGNVRPTTLDTMAFRETLRAAVDQYYKSSYSIKLPEYELPEGSCTIRLKWNDRPMDMDLHLVITDNVQKHHIWFRQKGLLHSSPFAQLSGDVRCGNGDEWILINRWMPAQYDVYVHDYHDTEDIFGAITVLIETDGQPKYAISRTEPIKRGGVWHPYTIFAGKIIPVNDTVDYSEIEKEVFLNTDQI